MKHLALELAGRFVSLFALLAPGFVAAADEPELQIARAAAERLKSG